MSKKKVVFVISFGILCVILALAAGWYSLNFNNGRLVYPTDFSQYSFIAKDIPMIAAIGLCQIYGIYLLISLFSHIISVENKKLKSGITRRLSPKLGFLGFFGFLGLSGFWTYGYGKIVFPFAFFCFFGFFGFFYEGKMSNILMDERYKENKQKAQLMAYRIGFVLIWILVFLNIRLRNFEYMSIIFISGISIIIAVMLFLSEYLLYRYDREDASEDY